MSAYDLHSTIKPQERTRSFYVNRASTQKATKLPLKGNKVSTQEPKASQASAIPGEFNFYLYPSSQRAQVFADRVFDRWLTTGHTFYRPVPASVLERYRKIVEVIAINLSRAVILGLSSGVRISRELARYNKKSRYRPDAFDAKTLTVLDELETIKLLSQVTGEQWQKHPFQAGEVIKRDYKQTEITPTSVLKATMEELSVSSLDDFEEATEQQEVVLLKKGDSSALMEYPDDDERANKFRRQMQVINQALANAGSFLAPEVPPSLKIDQRRRFLVRRFTYGSFEKGGRLWGGFWQEIKRIQRPHFLRIKGESTAECDFNSIVVRLAYAYASKERGELPIIPKGDLYTIPGLSPESRDGVKKLFSALLFDEHKNRDRFPKHVAEKFSECDQRKGFAFVLRQIKAYHPSLVSLFGTGIGHKLQFLESQLLVNVLLHLNKKGIVALPIHDCVIIPASQAYRTKGIMEAVSLLVLGLECPVSVKEGILGR